MRVLLLDLSLRCTGYAVVEWDENLGLGPHLLEATIAAGEIPLTDTSISLQERLAQLGASLKKLYDDYLPTLVAAEMPKNMFQARPGGKSVSNNNSAMMQQRAFGVAMYVYWTAQVPFIEVDPSLSKFCLTGNKQASKTVVADMLALLLGITRKSRGYNWPKGWTEAVRDALAVLAFLDYRRKMFYNQPDGWLAHLLHEQHKPFLGINNLDLTDAFPGGDSDNSLLPNGTNGATKGNTKSRRAGAESNPARPSGTRHRGNVSQQPRRGRIAGVGTTAYREAGKHRAKVARRSA